MYVPFVLPNMKINCLQREKFSLTIGSNVLIIISQSLTEGKFFYQTLKYLRTYVVLSFFRGKSFSSCLQQLTRGRSHTTTQFRLLFKALKIMYLFQTFSILKRNQNISQIFAIIELMDFPRNFQTSNITSRKKLYYISFILNFLLYLIRAFDSSSLLFFYSSSRIPSVLL